MTDDHSVPICTLASRNYSVLSPSPQPILKMKMTILDLSDASYSLQRLHTHDDKKMMPFYLTRTIYLQSYKTDGVVTGRARVLSGYVSEDIQSAVTEERREGLRW